jgi:hypothetical protein
MYCISTITRCNVEAVRNPQCSIRDQQPASGIHHPATIQQPATSNHHPAASNQQPATSNQQPATSNQQPATNNHIVDVAGGEGCTVSEEWESNAVCGTMSFWASILRCLG